MMKKVAIVCAAGKEGRLLVDEAVARGYDVTGIVRRGGNVANPAAKKAARSTSSTKRARAASAMRTMRSP